MRKYLSYALWAASIAYFALNGGNDCESASVMLLIGIVAGFLVQALPDGFDGLSDLND